MLVVASLWVAEQKLPNPWVGIHRGVVGQLVGEPPRGAPLGAHECVGVIGTEQVGTPGGPVQQRSTGEHRDRVTAVRDRVGQVGVRVTGRVQDPHGHRTHLHDIAVTHPDPVEADRVVGVDQVRRTGRPGQRIPAGDVVVVDVRLDDMRDPHPGPRGRREHPVDVPLRVDHQGDLPVVHQVAPIPETGRLDRHDRDRWSHGPLTSYT